MSTDAPTEATTRVPSGVPIDDPVDREWESGLEPAAVKRDRQAAEAKAAGAPKPRPPRTRARWIATLAAAWRQLTSMRTALLLLLLLQLAPQLNHDSMGLG